MITDNVEQRSLTWYRNRVGHITGSKVADIMKSGRKNDEVFSETAKAYLFQIAGERLFNPDFLTMTTSQPGRVAERPRVSIDIIKPRPRQ